MHSTARAGIWNIFIDINNSTDMVMVQYGKFPTCVKTALGNKHTRKFLQLQLSSWSTGKVTVCSLKLLKASQDGKESK